MQIVRVCEVDDPVHNRPCDHNQPRSTKHAYCSNHAGVCQPNDRCEAIGAHNLTALMREEMEFASRRGVADDTWRLLRVPDGSERMRGLNKLCDAPDATQHAFYECPNAWSSLDACRPI